MKKTLLKQALAISIMLFLAFTTNAATKTWDGGASDNNWNSANNWNNNTLPANGDDIVIPDGFTVIVNVGVTCASLTIQSGGSDNTLTINSGITLTVNGAVSIEAGTGNNDDKFIAVGSGTLTCSSVTMAATGDDSRNCEITISTGTVNVSGDITMNGTAARNAIRFSGAGTLNVGGNVASGGDIIPSSTTAGLVAYNGTTGDQTVKSDIYADITFSGGATKTIATGGIIVTDVTTFTNGVVNSTATNSFTINAGGSATGASDNSFVNGPIAKTGNTAFTFPVGTTTGTNRLHTIAVASISASTTFTGQYIRASASTLDPDKITGLYSVSNCEYWSLVRSGASATADVMLSWNANSGCGSGSYINTTIGLIVAWRDPVDSRWENSLGASQSASSASPFTTGTLTRVTVNANGFGNFTFGSTSLNGSPLPVKFSTIRAYEKQGGVQVDWTAYSEENLSHYQVERSGDGASFVALGNISARNSMVETKYGFFDANPLPGVNFYRLRAIDLDSKTNFSAIVKVNLDKSVKDITVYPNPATGGYVSFQSTELTKGNYVVKVFNANGQQVYNQQLNHNGGAINQTIQLPAGTRPGLYSMMLESAGVKVMTRSFMVQ